MAGTVTNFLAKQLSRARSISFGFRAPAKSARVRATDVAGTSAGRFT